MMRQGGSTIRSASVSTAIPSTGSGSSPTSKKCSTIRPSSPSPTGAFQATGTAGYRQVAQEIFAYVLGR